MIEPQSAQLGESALTLNATLVPPPSSSGFIGFESTAWPLVWPFPFSTGTAPDAVDPEAWGEDELALEDSAVDARVGPPGAPADEP